MSEQQPWNGQPSTERLQAGEGTALPRSRKGGRKGLIIGGGVVALVLAGGGVWAWQAYVGQGPQPAEALPADTVAYMSVDLDPSGKQKIEALKTLRKFPAFKDEVGLDTDDDLRKELFDSIQDDGYCPDLDYDEDIEPWLGDRAGVAVLDEKGEQPVFVVQVTDQGKAEDGLDALVNCGGDASGQSEEIGGYAFTGDWVVLAETEDIASDAVADAEEDSLADDEDYDRWTSALGDAGVLNFYAAPEAGNLIAQVIGGELGADDPAVDEALQSLEDFPGAAATIRFNDGSLELESVTSQIDEETAKVLDSDRGADVASTLPDSTAIALGAGFSEGWGQVLLDQMAPAIEQETGMSIDEAIAEAEATVGIDLPEDVETLLGESFTVAFDSGFDAQELVQGPSGPDEVPAGIKVQGDPDEIEPILEQMRSTMNPEAAEALEWKVEGDHVVIGFDGDYLDTLKDKGDLGDSDVFEKVIPEADESAALLFANFDADDWLVRVVDEAGAPSEVVDNLKPLEGLGVSSWTDDDETHMLLKITTED